MLLHVVKTKEGLTVLESPHITKIRAYMNSWGKKRGFVVTTRMTNKKTK